MNLGRQISGLQQYEVCVPVVQGDAQMQMQC